MQTNRPVTEHAADWEGDKCNRIKPVYSTLNFRSDEIVQQFELSRCHDIWKWSLTQVDTFWHSIDKIVPVNDWQRYKPNSCAQGFCVAVKCHWLLSFWYRCYVRVTSHKATQNVNKPPNALLWLFVLSHVAFNKASIFVKEAQSQRLKDTSTWTEQRNPVQ